MPTKVVPAVVNKLLLSSTLGEVAAIPTPVSFGLFVTGLDTTTTPPTVVTPNPEFTLVPPQAGSIQEMQVALNPNFLGPLRVLASQTNPNGVDVQTELGAHRDSSLRGLNVGQTLRQDDTSRLVFHNEEFEMRLPDSAFTERNQALLRLYKRSVAKSFFSGVGYSVSGGIYEVSNPSGVSFREQPSLVLGVPARSESRKHTLKKFTAAKLDWFDLVDSVKEEKNSFGKAALAGKLEEMDGSYYALLGSSRPLTAGEVQILPNPFSPLVLAQRDGNTKYGTRIRFHPESDRSSEVTVSVKIYNLDGELVRILIDHKTVPKAPVDFYWDGKVDGGRWARNGRYVIKITVNATGFSATKHITRPVVVFQ